jgi:ABC-type sugar transport system ATPase subunit
MITVTTVSKLFPGVRALDQISFHVGKARVHGLVGENGAGKSTIVKILSGVYTDYDGEILVDGKPIAFRSVGDARESGIATVFQELTVVKDLNIAENIFLGREPLHLGCVVDRKHMRERCLEVMSFLEEPMDIDEKVGNLSVASQQIVEICKALVLNAKVIIMDEPTSSLTEKEVGQLYTIIEKLRNRGVTILYVSHKLTEIFTICDDITVFRDGKHIKTVPTHETDTAEVIRMMVGRELNMLFPERMAHPSDDVLLSVEHASRKKEFHDVSFQLHRGEILGFAGLIGAGRTELAKALFGATKLDNGSITLAGINHGNFTHPRDSITKGLSYLPEDRKGEGLLLQFPIVENMTLAILKALRLHKRNSKKKERELVDKYAHDLQIKMVGISQIVELLSGGNQQKVIVARLLLTNTEVFIFDEPTRGIDVGAKFEIYKIMNELTSQGKGILFISSELPEVLGISDRIICMREGSLTKVFDRKVASAESIMKVLAGGESQ